MRPYNRTQVGKSATEMLSSNAILQKNVRGQIQSSEEGRAAGRILSSTGSDKAENGISSASEGARIAGLFWGEIASNERTEKG